MGGVAVKEADRVSNYYWRTDDEAGFTLIEIISVILLLGIIAAVVVPKFDTSGINADTTADSIKADLKFVQELAMSRNPQTAGAVGIVFTQNASSYTITDPGPSGMYTQTRTLSQGAAIISPTTTISFDKYGEPEIAAASVSIQISVGEQIKTISVQQYSGKVTIT